MLGLIAFLIGLLIVVILINMICDQFSIVPKIRLVVFLVLALLVLMWLVGAGGWNSVYGWHFPKG